MNYVVKYKRKLTENAAQEQHLWDELEVDVHVAAEVPALETCSKGKSQDAKGKNGQATEHSRI